MTPGKLLALIDAKMDDFELSALPVDKLSWIYHNSVRDAGSEGDGHGNGRRSPAPFLPLELFRTVRNSTKTLAAKDGLPEDPSLTGAVTNKAAWLAFSGAKRGKR